MFIRPWGVGKSSKRSSKRPGMMPTLTVGGVSDSMPHYCRGHGWGHDANPHCGRSERGQETPRRGSPPLEGFAVEPEIAARHVYDLGPIVEPLGVAGSLNLPVAEHLFHERLGLAHSVRLDLHVALQRQHV